MAFEQLGYLVVQERCGKEVPLGLFAIQFLQSGQLVGVLDALSDYAHADAKGFINLTWLSSIGKPFLEGAHADLVETKQRAASDVCPDQRVSKGGLVPSPL